MAGSVAGPAAVTPLEDERQIVGAHLDGLMWLGSKGNPEMMEHRASPSWSVEQHDWDWLWQDTRSTSSSLTTAIRVVFSRNSRYSAESDRRWTREGMVLALTRAMELGLEADNSPAARIMAADILVAMGPLARPATPVLHRYLEDDDPRVRMRVAAALMLTGSEGDRVMKTLVQSASECREDVPPAIKNLVDGDKTLIRE